jgi:tellurite resistance protein
MLDYQKTMVKSLVAVAWADGKLQSEESEVIDAVLSAFEASATDAAEIREYARTPKTLEDVPISDLSESDRDALLQHAVIITFIDGQQDEKERTFLIDLANRLGMPEDRRDALLSQATARAKRLLS